MTRSPSNTIHRLACCRRAARAACLLAGALVLGGCQSAESTKTIVIRGHAMGTSWQVTVPRRPASFGASEWHREIVAELERLESQMSTWRDDSLVSQFNRWDSTQPFEITSELAAVVREAQRTCELTHGAFDISAAPLFHLWGFGPGGRTQGPPREEQIQAALVHVDSAQLRVTESDGGSFALIKRNPHVKIDLSALAKGFAIDVIAEFLNARHCESYLVELGGELRARGTNAAGKVWQIGLEQPEQESIGKIRRTLALQDSAIATSGSYRNFHRATFSGGTANSHIIDPRTGRPVDHRLVSVSVVNSSAMRADAWATALMVLGPDEGFRLAVERQMAATFVIQSNGGTIERSTEPFKRMASQQN